ncbi:MAG TPA: tetratricopeptide repeat protein, partial [Candidatus Polarisedimenticolia bacterium]|nr:tetratricopeptide repeat protein [Candidatus Polarisedimenticolia bacterium]
PSAWEKSQRARFLLLLGRLHWLEGRHREAGAALRSAIDEGGPEGVLEYALGMNHLAAGEPDLASRAAYRLGQERHESRPGWTEPWRLLLVGEVALAAGDVAPAIEQFRSAWRLESPLAIDCIAGHSDAYFLDALGRAHLAGGRHGEALAAFDQILALGIRGLHQPEIVVPALYRSALALEALGRRPAAAERLRRFVRLWGSAQPASPMVRDAARRLEALTTGR